MADQPTRSDRTGQSRQSTPAIRTERCTPAGRPTPRGGLASLARSDAEDFSVIEAIGGPRGIVESLLPGLVFVVMFIITSNLQLTVIVSAVLAGLQVLVRLAQRQSAMGALSGLIAVGICLVWAWNSHEARNYYTFGFITNAVYLVALSVSMAVRVPGVGLLVEFIRTLPTGQFGAWLADWKNDRPLWRAYMIVTALWTGLFGVRLLVQVPLYLADNVAALGITRLVMGIPFWALAIWVSYLIIATPLYRHKVASAAIAVSGAAADADASEAGRTHTSHHDVAGKDNA